MSTFVIGDVHGCLDTLLSLLEHCRFDPQTDRLWFVGDLINRGSQNAQTLRFIRSLGSSATCVLGNHDLSLLALAAGADVKISEQDTSHTLLHEPDAPQLIDWLRAQKMLHLEDDYLMVHAGLLPDWSIKQAQQLAQEVQDTLQGAHWKKLMHKLFGNHPKHWSNQLEGTERLRVIINAMTRLRFLSAKAHMDMKPKGTPEQAPSELIAWFDYRPAAWRGTHTILFGHWSALGLKQTNNTLCLDSGCAWGRQLTALRLEDRKIFQVPSTLPRVEEWNN